MEISKLGGGAIRSRAFINKGGISKLYKSGGGGGGVRSRALAN